MPEQPTQPSTAISWKQLLRRLKRQKAVLLLGPEVPMLGQKDSGSIKDALQDYVKRDLEEILQEYDLHKIEYYNEDGFFHLEEDYKTEVIYPIVEFYKGLNVTEVHDKLAALPFHLILSLSPDDLICKAMDAQGLPYTFHYYDKRHYNKTDDQNILDFKPSIEKRLIYNLFGNIHNEGSLILSYDDLFEFLQRIFNNYRLPDAVRETVLDADYFVFIGFNYSKWYLKLLLRLMGLHEKVRTVYGMDTPARPDLETFFVNEFDMNFTRLNAVTFIDQLYEECKNEGILVEGMGSGGKRQKIDASLAKQVENCIVNDELQEGLQLLKSACAKDVLPVECCLQQVQLSARLTSLNNDNAKGVLDYRDFTLQRNILINDLLELLNEYS